tara:strand:- start:1752 stop:2210 length:459 start_codon:yes stop_codon:yes gene_type:complete
MNINDEYMKAKQLEKDTPLLQLRNSTGTNQLHIQGYGSESNREYGYAEKFTVPTEIQASLNQLQINYEHGMYQSFASDNPIYYRGVLEVRQYKDGHQLRIALDDNAANDDHTWVLDMNTPQCIQFIHWCKKNGLVVDMQDEMRFVVKAGEEE